MPPILSKPCAIVLQHQNFSGTKNCNVPVCKNLKASGCRSHNHPPASGNHNIPSGFKNHNVSCQNLKSVSKSKVSIDQASGCTLQTTPITINQLSPNSNLSAPPNLYTPPRTTDQDQHCNSGFANQGVPSGFTNEYSASVSPNLYVPSVAPHPYIPSVSANQYIPSVSLNQYIPPCTNQEVPMEYRNYYAPQNHHLFNAGYLHCNYEVISNFIVF